MKLFFPAYYHNFRCLASKCNDSCCKEWIVDVDATSAAYYRTVSGPLGDRLRAVLKDTENGTIMEIENGRCPMWQTDGLCWIHKELGHDALCETCRNFPRLRHDYGDFIELGLELSCPEAARLILTAKNPETLTSTQPGGSAPDYDPAAMNTLRTSRKAALDFLANTPDLPKALAAILLYAHDVQAALDCDDAIESTTDTCLAEVNRYRNSGDMRAIFKFFENLEILTDDWKTRLQQVPASPIWSDELKAFARYLIERYWLQAISDHDLICRVKFIIIACLLVAALGGDPIRTAQQFSKEIENNPDNVEAIFDGAYTAPALTDSNLLALLLQ